MEDSFHIEPFSTRQSIDSFTEGDRRSGKKRKNRKDEGGKISNNKASQLSKKPIRRQIASTSYQSTLDKALMLS